MKRRKVTPEFVEGFGRRFETGWDLKSRNISNSKKGYLEVQDAGCNWLYVGL